MSFQRIILTDPIQPKDIQLIQDNINNAITPLQQIPMVGGRVISVSLLTAQDNVVTHSLGHNPTLWLLGNLNANAVVWSTAATTNTITLQCSADCSISLWIN